MIAEKEVARRKLGLLQLASELNDVSKACLIKAIPVSSFMRSGAISKPLAQRGLLDRIAGFKTPHPNRLPKEIEDAILKCSLDFFTHGPLAFANC